MTNYSVDQWDKAIQAMPDMRGFNTDSTRVFAAALRRLSPPHRARVVAVLEAGGRSEPAKHLAGAQLNDPHTNAAFAEFRVKLGVVLDEAFNP